MIEMRVNRRQFAAALCGATGALAGCQSVDRQVQAALGPRIHHRDAPVDTVATWPTQHGRSDRTGSISRDLELDLDSSARRIAPSVERGKWGIVVSGDRIIHPGTAARSDSSGESRRPVYGLVGTSLDGESWAIEDTHGPSLVVGETVICSLGDGVAAFDASDGTVCWRYSDGGYPTLAGGLVCTTSGHTLFGLDPRDGRRHWKTENFSDGARFEYTVSKLAGDDKLLCGVRTVEYDADSLVAFDPTTGAVRWRGDTGPCRHPPVVGDERVYTLSSEWTLTAFNRRGEQLWTRDVGWESLPAVDDGQLWSAGPDGEILVRDGETGRKQWQTTVGNVAPSRPLLTPSYAYVLVGELEEETRLLMIDRVSKSVRRSQSVPVLPKRVDSQLFPPLAASAAGVVIGESTGPVETDEGGVYVVS